MIKVIDHEHQSMLYVDIKEITTHQLYGLFGQITCSYVCTSQIDSICSLFIRI